MREAKITAMLAAVRGCLGTPFHHQGRRAGVGLDCIGLVIVGLRAAGVWVRDQTDYGMRPDGVSLIAALEAHGAVRVSDIQSGDILVFRYDHQPQHVAVALSADRLMHSFAPARRVVESCIGAYWRRRLVAVYRFDFGEEG